MMKREVIKYAKDLHASNIIIDYLDSLEYKNKDQGEIEHIIDFLIYKDFSSLKWASYELLKEKSLKWVKQLSQNVAIIDEEEGKDIESVLDFQDGFRFVKLLSKPAYRREGALMSHCVALYYGKDIEIYSLRDEFNKPHCTIEKDNQIKGKGNGPIHSKYIDYVVKFLEWLGMRVRDNEMKNLGYIVPKFNWYCLNKKYRGKYVRNNEDLIYSDDIIIFYDINEAKRYKGSKIVCLDGDIDLYNIEISKEFTMPRYVHGRIILRGAILPEIFIMPQYVWGGIDLGGLTIPEGFKMPKYVDGYLYMCHTEIPKGLIMPQYVGSSLDMNEAIIPEGFVMPQYVWGGIDLGGLTIPKGFIFPKDVMGTINLKNSTIPKDFVVPEYLSVAYS